MIGAARAVGLLHRRELSAEQLVRDCLSRIAEREPSVQAWEVVDAEGALREARRVDLLRERPLLCGLPVGIKDLIDTAGLPTTYGSRIYRDHRPAQDAACVRALREAGAIVLGKTVTTEFAGYAPGKTRNPHDLARGGAEVREVELPASFKGLLEAQVAIMGGETAISLRRELEDSPGELSARLREVLEAGRACSAEQLAKAQAQAALCRGDLDRLLGPLDALLTLAVAGEAPVGLDSTGDPSFCRIWTLLGTPCVSLPVLRGPAGLPVGLQLVGKRGGDEELLGAAAFVLASL